MAETVKTEEPTEEEEEEDIPITKFGRVGVADSMKLTKGSTQERSTATTVASSKDLSIEPGEHSDRSIDHSNVKFGNVHIHQHRMTLGDNPEAKGAPVMIAWDSMESEEFDVDTYEDKQWVEGNGHMVRKIPRGKREKIAMQNHTRTSIAEVDEAMKEIRVSRESSEKEDINKAIKKEEKDRKREERRAAGEGRIMGRLLHRWAKK